MDETRYRGNVCTFRYAPFRNKLWARVPKQWRTNVNKKTILIKEQNHNTKWEFGRMETDHHYKIVSYPDPAYGFPTGNRPTIEVNRTRPWPCDGRTVAGTRRFEYTRAPEQGRRRSFHGRFNAAAKPHSFLSGLSTYSNRIVHSTLHCAKYNRFAGNPPRNWFRRFDRIHNGKITKTFSNFRSVFNPPALPRTLKNDRKSARQRRLTDLVSV